MNTQTKVLSRPDRRSLRLRDQILMTMCLAGADICALQLAIYLGYQLDVLLRPGPAVPEVLPFDPILALDALAIPFGYYLLGIYRVHGRAPIERFRRRIQATCLLFGLLMLWGYVTRNQWTLTGLAVTLLLALLLPLLGESAVKGVLISRGWWGIRTVVIGTGPTGRQVARILKQTPELGLCPVAFFDDDPREWGAQIDGIPVLGSIADSAEYADEIDTAVVTVSPTAQESLDAITMRLHFLQIILVPDLVNLQTLWVQARDLGGLIGLQMRRNLLVPFNRMMKQTIDYLLTPPMLLICTPVIVVLAAWISIISPGSPFYTQARLGKNGQIIKVWKLRTMYPDAEARLEEHLARNPAAREEWRRHFKLTDDPRILPGIGHLLRRTSLDELPQIYNVLRGEMSLVGPRPFPKYHLDQFDPAFQMLRASVMPGITGLWQISARSDGDLDVQRTLDTYYIRNWSIWMDIYILFRTGAAVVSGRGAR